MQQMMVLIELPDAAARAPAPCPSAAAAGGGADDRRTGRERRGTFSLDTAPPPNGKWEARPYVFRAFRERRAECAASAAAPEARVGVDGQRTAESAADGTRPGVRVIAAYAGGDDSETAPTPDWFDLRF